MRCLLFVLVLAIGGRAASAQLPAGTTDTTASQTAAPSPDDSGRAQASAARERGDYAGALRLLQPLAERNPRDAHVLFDLGAAQDALDQTSAAEASYRKAIAADASYFEPRLALGLLLARNARPDDARRELLAAVGLDSGTPPVDPALRARAYRALAHLEETSDPAAARDALLAALKLTPATPEDDRLSAALAVQSQAPEEAEAAYRRLLVSQPTDAAAAAGLGRLLVAAGKLDEAEAILAPALAAHANDPGLVTSLALVRARQQRPAEAVALVAPLYRTQPSDDATARLYASLLSASGDYAQAEQVLAPVLLRSPKDGPLLDQRADALIHLKRFAEAERLLTAATENPGSFPSRAALGETAGHLAFAAFSNNDPQETLHALTLRATFLPQSPSTLFLGAAAHDSLHHVRESRELYRQFLAAANGKFPDEETEARHRLLALQRTH